MTGTTFEAATETYGKRLQILKEIVPDLKRAAVLRAVGDPNVGFGLTLVPIDIKSADDLETAFATIKKSEVGALLPIAGVLTFTLDSEIADRALAAQFPLCSPFRDTAVAGELVSLGPDLVAMNRQAAAQVDKIIKGTSPADIPVEQPTRYELYINLNTARLLNLTVPPSLLARADDVIE
jgi:putative ABC transport system substrate-binding protein